MIQTSNDRGWRERRLLVFCGLSLWSFFVAADARLQPVGVLGVDFFLAIEQCLDGALLFFRIVRVKGVLNGAQDNMQRHAALFPALDQGPIDWTQHAMLAAAANKRVFSFGE